jgi:O-antigen/teichoic acid export membrane protein
MSNPARQPSLILNLAYNWIGQGANLAVMFFLSPLVVHSFGNTVYGIWSLLTVIVGYLGLLDMGIRASTGRYINYYLARNEREAINETVRTSLAFYLYLGLAFILIGYGFSFYFTKIFTQTPAEFESLLRVVFPLLAVNIWLTATSAIFTSIVTAHERFDRCLAVNMTALTIRTAGTLLVVNYGLGILGLTVTVLLANLAGCALNLTNARRLYDRLELSPLRVYGPRLRELFTFGIAAFLSSIAYTLINETDIVITGGLIGIEEVTLYAIGGMLILYSWGFVEQIGFTGFPALQRAAARHQMDDVHHLMLRQIRIGLFFATPVYVSLLVFGAPFIRLWMGAGYSVSAEILWILSIARLIALFSIAMGPCLTAMGIPRYNVYLMLTEAVINICSSILFVTAFELGVKGVALGTLVAVLLVRMVLQPLITLRKINLPFTRYLVSVIAPGTAALALIVIAGEWISSSIHVTSWTAFILSVGVLLIISIAIGLPMMTTADERRMIMRKIGRQTGGR